MPVLFAGGKQVQNNSKRRQRNDFNNNNNTHNNNNNNQQKPPNSSRVGASNQNTTQNENSDMTTTTTTIDPVTNLVESVVQDDDLNTAVDALRRLQEAGDDVFRAPRFKALRSVMFSLVAAPQTGHVARVSDALADGRWNDAILTLERMQEKKEAPKLGSVQRWVRDCDCASLTTNEGFRVLDMILRVSAPEQIATVPTPPELLENNAKAKSTRLIMREPWNNGRAKYLTRQEEYPPMIPDLNPEVISKFRKMFRVIGNEKGPHRNPPNLHDLVIWTSNFEQDQEKYLASKNNQHHNNNNNSKLKITNSATNQDSSSSSSSIFVPSVEGGLLDPSQSAIDRVQKLDVPFLPGCFMMKDLFSVEECHGIIQSLESAGYLPDKPLTGLSSVLAHNVVWLPDLTFMDTLISRCRKFMPDPLCGGKFTGINRRFRCYRYVPGAIYRFHVDGGWCPGGVDLETGKYITDVSNGTEYSKMTFLVYLNDGFEGGGTSYATPAYEKGYLNVQAVVPRCGSVMVFAHGETQGCLVHEGSGVTKGTKYIIRTEVMYTK